MVYCLKERAGSRKHQGCLGQEVWVPPGRPPQGGRRRVSPVRSTAAVHSPTWTASLASSWGWGPGSSLCSCVSAGGGNKAKPFRAAVLELGSIPAPGMEKTPLPSCYGGESLRGALLSSAHLPHSLTSPKADSQPSPAPSPQVPPTAVPGGYSRWKCVPCRQPVPGARGSAETGERVRAQGRAIGGHGEGGRSGEGL